MKLISRNVWYLRLLQLENYDLARFWKKIISSQPKDANTSQILWTKKLIIVFIVGAMMTVIIPIATITILVNIFSLNFLLQLFIISAEIMGFSVFFSIPLTIAVLLLVPMDVIVKRWILYRAKEKLKKFSKIKIIAITGSYGKTTMKEGVAAILREKFKVIMTPENKNTPLAIADLILKKISPSTEIFIVEMGAYKKGDIARLCRLTPPDISIITGINESHLERFGSLKNTIETKFEIADMTRLNGTIILNGDNSHIIHEYQKHTTTKKIIFYGEKTEQSSQYQTIHYQFSPETLQSSFDIINKKTKQQYHFKIPLIGKYCSTTCQTAIAIAELFGMTKKDIERGSFNIVPVQHRLQPFKPWPEITVIDDSYNGNPDGVAEAIAALKQFKNRKKIFVTPGLVEMGKRSENVHRNIGKQLSLGIDEVILMKNSVTQSIADELIKNGFDQTKIYWYDTPIRRKNLLQKIVQKGSVILFQNDWPDNYL